MARYRFTVPKTRLFRAAFFDTDCSFCQNPISKGDPLGQIITTTPNESDQSTQPKKVADYVCIECLEDHRASSPTFVERT
jgi:hypothetical protein